MKFHYAGKYNGDEASLPQREHEEGAVQFREPKDMKTLSLVANGIALGLIVIAWILLYLRSGTYVYDLFGLASQYCIWIYPISAVYGKSKSDSPGNHGCPFDRNGCGGLHECIFCFDADAERVKDLSVWNAFLLV